jgi:hypothetical protein
VNGPSVLNWVQGLTTGVMVGIAGFLSFRIVRDRDKYKEIDQILNRSRYIRDSGMEYLAKWEDVHAEYQLLLELEHAVREEQGSEREVLDRLDGLRAGQSADLSQMVPAS